MLALSNLLIHYKYFLLVPIAILEGPVVALVAGLLVHQGFFNFYTAYFILIMGDVISDSFSYAVGHYGKNLGWVEKRIKRSELLNYHLDSIGKIWEKHTLITLFLAKLAYGLTFPVLVSAGFVKFSYKKFIGNVLGIAIVQYALLLLVGYASGGLVDQVDSYLHTTYIVTAVLVLVLIIVYGFVTHYARKKLKSLLPPKSDVD